jgi:hypothetical protein
MYHFTVLLAGNISTGIYLAIFTSLKPTSMDKI